VKGVNFQNLRDIGDPVELGLEYENQGADELTFLDISATIEQRATVTDLVSRVAARLSIPFTVGGGITSIEDVRRLLGSGADKVTINTAAVCTPRLIEEIANTFGSQCCVLAIDAKRKSDSSWEVLVAGGKVPTGLDAFQWATEAVQLGAGEILLTSWDRDGSLEGFDIEMVRQFATNLNVPVIASGGARDPESFVEVFIEGLADAALAASIFHDRTHSISEVKTALKEAGVIVRLC